MVSLCLQCFFTKKAVQQNAAEIIVFSYWNFGIIFIRILGHKIWHNHYYCLTKSTRLCPPKNLLLKSKLVWPFSAKVFDVARKSAQIVCFCVLMFTICQYQSCNVCLFGSTTDHKTVKYFHQNMHRNRKFAVCLH